MTTSRWFAFVGGVFFALSVSMLVAATTAPPIAPPPKWEYRLVDQHELDAQLWKTTDELVARERAKFTDDQAAFTACWARVFGTWLDGQAKDGWMVVGNFDGYVTSTKFQGFRGQESGVTVNKLILGRAIGASAGAPAVVHAIADERLQKWCKAHAPPPKEKEEELYAEHIEYEASMREAGQSAFLEELNARGATGSRFVVWGSSRLIEYAPRRGER